jgi:hypothetical protein
VIKRLRIDEVKEGDKLSILSLDGSGSREEVTVVEVQNDAAIIKTADGYNFGIVTINGTGYANVAYVTRKCVASIGG